MIPFRWLLMGSLACPLISPVSLHGEVGKPQEVTQGVWFHEGDLDAVKDMAPVLKEKIQLNDRIANYVGSFFEAQIEKMFDELNER